MQVDLLWRSYDYPATLQRIKRRTYNVQIMDGWMDHTIIVLVHLF